MKKNYFYLLAIIMTAMLSFSSCSNDDDSPDLKEYEKENTVDSDTTTIFSISKLTKFNQNYASLTFDSGKRTAQLLYKARILELYPMIVDYSIIGNLTDINFKELKVGDNICKYIPSAEADFLCDLYLSSTLWEDDKGRSTKYWDTPTSNKRSIKITHIDEEKEIIYLKFNLELTIGGVQTNTKYVSGVLPFSYRFTN